MGVKGHMCGVQRMDVGDMSGIQRMDVGGSRGDK